MTPLRDGPRKSKQNCLADPSAHYIYDPDDPRKSTTALDSLAPQCCRRRPRHALIFLEEDGRLEAREDLRRFSERRNAILLAL